MYLAKLLMNISSFSCASAMKYIKYYCAKTIALFIINGPYTNCFSGMS